MEEQQQTVCPWCHTEIVWDEELGPERHCPHCGNELSGYRTLQLGLDAELEDEVDDLEEEDEDPDWEDNESFKKQRDAALGDLSELRQYSRERLALDETMERILDDQLEAPECPSCREYMLEVGSSHVTGESFTSRTPAAMTIPLLPTPFDVVMYVCPSCFHTENRLSAQDQERFVRSLAKAAEEGQ
ncbi:hypothetical protein Back11_62680 [Paenibacillus baekrokdamisoli]|uniref:Uncharacterized protein n=1 Tax=Paenibacillus baekrokdamisoli TaxID=1712516 RepID=A0A3G9JIW1_9BACL|nr:hypothetical protein [Paenibacillus baekrokdamisoli]MBB3069503.1 ribosomal protein L37AE/L43A [Paenibacillus baekrokdamisoli]BBH24923.1 hypothetical protein Back11_62680 [Paenibacillus baekrokdamisoli]